MPVDTCPTLVHATYCVFLPHSAVSFILKTELDPKTNFFFKFFGLHLNYLSYPPEKQLHFPFPVSFVFVKILFHICFDIREGKLFSFGICGIYRER